MGEKPQNIENENQGKNLAALPSPRLRKWRPTVFRCPKTPKTSRTYPKWNGGPSLAGKEIQGWVRCGQLNCRECELYTSEFSRSSTKAGWDTG